MIKIKKSHEGLLHKELGVAEGKKIPAKKLEKAAHSSDPAMRKRAVFAENAKHWNHADGGHADEAQDKVLIRKALKKSGVKPGKFSEGGMAYKNAGVNYKGTPPKNTVGTLGDKRAVDDKMTKQNLWGDDRFEQPEFKSAKDRVGRKSGGHVHDGIAMRGHTRAKFK
jgi:hypothetical protein